MTVSKAPDQDRPPGETDEPATGARIVVGADSSYWGQIALRWAAEHAWLAGGELEVHRPPVPMTDADRLGQILRGFPMLPVAVQVGVDAVSDLVSASRRADLVVLGCRGNDHPGLGIGAAVTPIVTAAECDVMVVGGRPAAVRGTHHQISVLVGTDNDGHALASAAGLAVLRRVPLRILLAAPLVGAHPLRGSVDDQLAALRGAEAVARRFEPSVRTTTELVRNSPHEVVSTMDDTDVLVLGVRERPDAVTRLALHHAVSPVLIARGGLPARHRMDSVPKAGSSVR